MIDLSKTGLADKYAAAGVSLRKHALDGVRAAVYLVLDYSGSMRPYYANGSVQHLAEQVLALAARFDDDGTVPTVLFDSVPRQPANLSVHNYSGAVTRLVSIAGRMGTTDYAKAMQTVIDLHSASTTPAFVVFQTDGAPDSRAAAERVLCDAAHLPIFWQFIGFGNDKFAFLRRLDTLKVPDRRVVDNAGFFPAGPDPKSIPDEQLYDDLVGEFPSWLQAYSRFAQAGAPR